MWVVVAPHFNDREAERKEEGQVPTEGPDVYHQASSDEDKNR